MSAAVIPTGAAPRGDASQGQRGGGELSSRILELDGLRGIAIGMVVLYHYFFQTIAANGGFLGFVQASTRLGWSGVDLFFVLSGFLIGGILLDARNASNYFQVFYLRRFFRIVPIYFVYLSIAVGLWWLGTRGVTANFEWVYRERLPWLPHFLFLQNFWMAFASSMGALGVTWSLAVEEQFYLTLPGLVRLFSGAKLQSALVAGIILAPVSRIVLHAFAPTHYLAWYTLMPCRADALLLGVLGAMLLRSPEWKSRLEKNRKILLVLAAVLGAGLVAMTVHGTGPFGIVMLTVGYSWIALFYLTALLCAVLYRETWFGSSLRWAWLRWVGSIAYGVYLFHGLFLRLVQSLLFAGPAPVGSAQEFLVSLAALALTLAFCSLSWRYFEKPLVELGHRWRYEKGTPEKTVPLLSLNLERSA